MPKITVHEGPSYGGHVDIAPEHATEPEWVPVAAPADDGEVDDDGEPDPTDLKAGKRGRHEKE